jgi:hypothetical protein
MIVIDRPGTKDPSKQLTIEIIDRKYVVKVNGIILPKQKQGTRMSGTPILCVVNEVVAITEDEGNKLIAAYKAIEDEIKAKIDLVRSAERQEAIDYSIKNNSVTLQKHCYGDTEWYLSYSENIKVQIYPATDITPDRQPSSTYMAGNRWILDRFEYDLLKDIPTSKPLIVYDLTEPVGIPDGVDLIETEYDKYHNANSKYQQAQEREQWAAYPNSDALVAALKQYPRAALYIQCKGQENAANHEKATAGVKAKDLLLLGGQTKDILHILDNWLSSSRKHD